MYAQACYCIQIRVLVQANQKGTHACTERATYLLPEVCPTLHKEVQVIRLLLQPHGLVVQHNIHALSNKALHHKQQPVVAAVLWEVGVAVALLCVVHGGDVSWDGLVPVLVDHMRADKTLLQHVDRDRAAILVQVLWRHVEILPGERQSDCRKTGGKLTQEISCLCWGQTWGLAVLRIENRLPAVVASAVQMTMRSCCAWLSAGFELLKSSIHAVGCDSWGQKVLGLAYIPARSKAYLRCSPAA